jgi:hypothetical protein
MQKWKKRLKKLSKKLLRTDSLEADITEQQQQPIELDEQELKKYVDLVIREVKKEGR